MNLGGITGDSGFCAVCRRTISDALDIYVDHTGNCYAPTFAKHNFLVCLLCFLSELYFKKKILEHTSCAITCYNF